MKRKIFLKNFARGSLAPCVIGLSANSFLSAEEINEKRAYHERRALLGSEVGISLSHESLEESREIVHEAYKEIYKVHLLMNLRDENSQISRLNREGVLREAHPYMVDILKSCRYYSQMTKGAFDITVQSLVSYLEKCKKQNELPSGKEVERLESKMTSGVIEISTKKILFNEPELKITLDGIARGYALDKCVTALLRHNVEIADIWIGGRERLKNIVGRLGAGKSHMTFMSQTSPGHFYPGKTNRSALIQSASKGLAVSAKNATEADALSTALMAIPSCERSAMINKFSDARLCTQAV